MSADGRSELRYHTFAELSRRLDELKLFYYAGCAPGPPQRDSPVRSDAGVIGLSVACRTSESSVSTVASLTAERPEMEPTES